MQEKTPGKYEFISEKIKKKPINKKNFLKRTLLTIGFGILFGIVASIVITILQPKMSDWVAEKTKPGIVIETDESSIDLEEQKDKDS
ncbi:MAG: serine protease, partial [Lachnospiraceae bacterium]